MLKYAMFWGKKILIDIYIARASLEEILCSKIE